MPIGHMEIRGGTIPSIEILARDVFPYDGFKEAKCYLRRLDRTRNKKRNKSTLATNSVDDGFSQTDPTFPLARLFRTVCSPKFPRTFLPRRPYDKPIPNWTFRWCKIREWLSVYQQRKISNKFIAKLITITEKNQRLNKFKKYIYNLVAL